MDRFEDPVYSNLEPGPYGQYAISDLSQSAFKMHTQVAAGALFFIFRQSYKLRRYIQFSTLIKPKGAARPRVEINAVIILLLTYLKSIPLLHEISGVIMFNLSHHILLLKDLCSGSIACHPSLKNLLDSCLISLYLHSRIKSLSLTP